MTKLTFESGKTYTCTNAQSPGYKNGETYKAYTNAKGNVCLRGDDGYEDICTMLVSSFCAA